MNMPWTEEVVDQMKTWRLAGASCGVILNKLASIGHVTTRNAVIGKLFRMGLLGGESRIPTNVITLHPIPMTPEERAERSRELLKARRETSRKGAFALKRNVVELPTIDTSEAAEPLMIKLADLQYHHCRFVIGEPRDGEYCGHNKREGSSYCPAHHRLIYQPTLRQMRAAG